MNELRVIYLQVKLRSMYTCKKCKMSKYGTIFTENINLNGDIQDSLKFLESIEPLPRNMPNGWASFYTDEHPYIAYRCDNHKREKIEMTQEEKQTYNNQIMLEVTGGIDPAELQEQAEINGWDR